MNRIVNCIFGFIVNYIRPYTAAPLFRIFYKTPLQVERWAEVRELPMYDFHREIIQYSYRSDMLRGLLDGAFNPHTPDYFFQDLKKGRDCDDFARIWRLWGEYWGCSSYEYVFTDSKHPFKRAHVVAILEKHSTEFWVMDYSPYGPFPSSRDAIASMVRKYPVDTMIYRRYEHEKERFRHS